jgi:hypothetical protein
MEKVRKYKIKETLTIETEHVITYTSGIGGQFPGVTKTYTTASRQYTRIRST